MHTHALVVLSTGVVEFPIPATLRSRLATPTLGGVQTITSLDGRVLLLSLIDVVTLTALTNTIV